MVVCSVTGHVILHPALALEGLGERQDRLPPDGDGGRPDGRRREAEEEEEAGGLPGQSQAASQLLVLQVFLLRAADADEHCG